MVLSGLCQDSYIVVRRVQRPVSSCWAVVAPFLPYVPECVGGRLAEKCSTFFLSLGRSRAGSLMGLRAEQRRASRPLEKARCMWRSPEFIGDSSPAASVEGARRGCPAVALQSRVLQTTAAGFILRAVQRRQARYKRLLAHVLDGVYPGDGHELPALYEGFSLIRE